MCDSPWSNLEVLGNGARKYLVACESQLVAKPQVEGMMYHSSNFPRSRNQCYQSSRTLKTWRRLLVVWSVNKHGPAHKTKTLSCPNFPRRLSIFPSCWKLENYTYRIMENNKSKNGTAKKQWWKCLKEGFINEENRTGGGTVSLVVSLLRKQTCWANKL